MARPYSQDLQDRVIGSVAVSIPESGSVEHVKQNAAALGLELSEQELEALDRAFPA